MMDKMLEFMQARQLCVISTVDSSGKPESAFVAYSSYGVDIVIGTSEKSRKFQNLVANPSVAIVIADETGEVQYEGQANVVSTEQRPEVEKAHIAQSPGSVRYVSDPHQHYIRITPTWIRFTEHGKEHTIQEFTEF